MIAFARASCPLGQFYLDPCGCRDFRFSCPSGRSILTIEAPGRQVIAVQMLRAVAATMVVFFHVNVHLMRLHSAPLHSAWMASGVDIFFVISGFIMWTSVEARGGMSAGAFFRNRLIRIVPLYWLLTAFVVAVALIAPET